MSTLILDPLNEVAIQSGSVVSKVIHRGDGMNVTVFGFDTGEELTEHQAARTAVVEVARGRLRFTVDGQELELPPGSWLHMTPGTPHSLVAVEPTIMLLTLTSTEKEVASPAMIGTGNGPRLAALGARAPDYGCALIAACTPQGAKSFTTVRSTNSGAPSNRSAMVALAAASPS
jgi:quercetin dioxygenase-like cupin family protein